MKKKNDNEIKIEKGIPLPDRKRHNQKKYPFEKMEVGDSFAVKMNGTSQLISNANSWKRWNNKMSVKFYAKYYKEEEIVRIWRIE